MTVEQFLATADQFKLGTLETELPHPLSQNLSTLAQNDLTQAIDVAKAIDLLALEKLQTKLAPVQALAQAIDDTLNEGNKIFLCGCGATGRLSLSIEVFCREGLLPKEESDRVVAFMAGGDAALIRSIENFEDHPEFGARQLTELGFAEGDLLISSTEGGETPFVIGATEEAIKRSKRPPWFLYCNPDSALVATVERSRNVIENPAIQKVNLSTGPMTIAGSTRMQASTVLMAAIALAFLHRKNPSDIPESALQFQEWVKGTDWHFLKAFIECESALYQNQGHVLYETREFGITVLTDTTERAPTFSLSPFENTLCPQDPASLCYLSIAETEETETAWKTVLKRRPRTFQWEQLDAPTDYATLMGYDISKKALAHREIKSPECTHFYFTIDRTEDKMHFALQSHEHRIDVKEKHSIFQHLFLKLLLNTHSTLVMGRLGRFEGNLMTYVKPSNKKLIDRAIRYVRTLYKRRTQKEIAYETVTREIFEQRKHLQPDEPIVLKTLDALIQKK